MEQKFCGVCESIHINELEKCVVCGSWHGRGCGKVYKGRTVCRNCVRGLTNEYICPFCKKKTVQLFFCDLCPAMFCDDCGVVSGFKCVCKNEKIYQGLKEWVEYVGMLRQMDNS